MKIFYICICAIALTLAGCGDDVVNNNAPNNPTGDSLIYSLDSAAVNGAGSILLVNSDTVMLNTLPANIKIVFSSETNCGAGDTVEAITRFKYIAGSTALMYVDTLLNTFNAAHTFTATIDALTPPQSFVFELRLFKNSVGIKYLRLKNIRIYKIISQ